MNQLLNLSYWFNVLPGDARLPFWRIIIATGVLCVIIGVFAVFIMRKYKKDGLRYRLWAKWASWGFTSGLVFFLLAFFRLQNAYFLSMRLWIFLWIAFVVVWVLWIIRYMLIVVPRRLKARNEVDEFKKYLPGKR